MDPLVEEVDSVEANPRYAYISFPDGRQSTVATKNLAPMRPRTLRSTKKMKASLIRLHGHLNQEGQSTTQRMTSDTSVGSPSTKSCDVGDVTTVDAPTHSNEHTVLRRSQRERRPVDRLSYNKFFNISWYYKGGVNVVKITVWKYASCAHTALISYSLIAFGLHSSGWYFLFESFSYWLQYC